MIFDMIFHSDSEAYNSEPVDQFKDTDYLFAFNIWGLLHCMRAKCITIDQKKFKHDPWMVQNESVI